MSQKILLGLSLASAALLGACSTSNTPPIVAAVQQYTVTVQKLGGNGRVRSEPAGLDCGSACSMKVDAGQPLHLLAEAGTDMRFVGWSGDCAALDCLLTVNADKTVTALFAPLGPPPPPPVTKACDAYAGTAVASLSHYEGMTHEHSAYSDGDPHFIPADYYRIGKERGYDFVAGSEHSDSLDAGNYATLHASCDPTTGSFDPTAVEYCFLNPSADKLVKWNNTLTQAQAASSPTFLAVRGFEWTSDVFGHINVYFSQNFTNAKDDLGYALTMQTFWDWFTRDPGMPGLAGAPSSPVPFGGGADGLASFNHPHDKCLFNDDPTGTFSGWCDWNDYTLIPDAETRMFGIEAYNDNNRDDRYQPYLARALDKGWHLSFLGSEDEHFAHYAVEERPKTVTLAKSLGENDFKEAWLARRTYALTPGQHLRAQLLADGAHPMGSHLSCDASKGTLPLEVKLTQKDGSAFTGDYQLYTNAGQKLASITGAQATFQLPIEAGKERWYFVRVHGPDGKSVAYLAPVWVTGK